MLNFFLGMVVLAVVEVPIALFYYKVYVKRRKELLERTHHSERLAYVGALAGGLAHEIKNPLSTLNINLQLLGEDWQDRQDDKAKRALRKIDVLQHEVKRLEEILNEFLSLTRKRELNLEKVDINALVDEVLDFVAPEFRMSNIHILKSYDHSIPEINIDKRLMKQALINIVINAEQAMDKGGELMVRTQKVPRYVQIEITDTGPGIAVEDLEKIFNVYFSTKRGGSGLGLPISKRIVEDHFGSITVESEKNKGTIFRIKIPLQ